MTRLLGIISGGQTGADQAGLRAAKALGLTTGGLMPKGFLTEDGPRPQFREMFGMGESFHGAYAKRTRWNIQHADATVIFCTVQHAQTGDRATDGEGIPAEPGSALTYGVCVQLERPALVVEWDPLHRRLGGSPAMLRDWLASHHVTILNVAGNRESVAPGIGAAVQDFLEQALRGES